MCEDSGGGVGTVGSDGRTGCSSSDSESEEEDEEEEEEEGGLIALCFPLRYLQWMVWLSLHRRKAMECLLW